MDKKKVQTSAKLETVKPGVVLDGGDAVEVSDS